MRTKFEELVCSSETARAVLSACLDDRGTIAGFVYDWQTLIAGGLAVGAAAITGYLLWVQIRDQRNEVKRQQKAVNLAARIRLPHALAELNAYWSACFDAWRNGAPQSRPTPPFAALETVMKAAPVVDDKSFKSMQILVELAQAFESRLNHHGRARPRNISEVMVADIGELTWLTNRLYEFGRMEVEEIPYVKPTRSEIEEVLNLDLEIRHLSESNPLRIGVERALRMRFPGSAITSSNE